MSGRNNKLLIICYSFPPHPGIGGRRWAKFSKLLALKNYDVSVVSAKNFHSHVSFWNKDVINDKLKPYQFKFSFQRILKHPASIGDKILRKVVLFFINKTKYNPSIITSLPNKPIWRQIKEIIVSQNINKVIVSGDPYLFYYTCLLRKELEFDLVLDYRDLWNDHSFYDKNVILSKKQKEFFLYAENYAVNNCNKIIFVDEYLESVIKKRIRNDNILTFVMHNGFDTDDFIVDHKTKPVGNIIKFFFAGSVSSDLNESLINFIFAYNKLAGSKQELFSKFSISVYGEIDADLVRRVKSLNMKTVFIDSKGLDIKTYYEKLSSADVGIVILSDEYKNSFITKFSDYLFYNKFTVALGHKGYFTEYIEQHNIGLGFDGSNPEAFFEKLLLSVENSATINEVEKDKFNLSVVTEKLIKEVIEG